MEFIDLLKVGANKQEVAIASSKITTPTIDMDGAEIQSVIALLVSSVVLGEDSTFDPTFGGVQVMSLVYVLPKEDFISTFGDILHVGTYNFYSFYSNVDGSLLSSASTVEETGEGESTSIELNVSTRVVSYPILGMYLGEFFGFGPCNVYVLVPDDFLLKAKILDYLVIMGVLNASVLSSPLIPDIGIPVIDIGGQEVMFGLGLYSLLSLLNNM